jgi:phosphoglucomutase
MKNLGKGPTFEFGYEESYGCLIAPFVRDKDGIQAICSIARWLYGISYDKLMEKYGYHDAVCNSVYFEGPQGAANMAKIMETLHDHPLRQIAGVPVDEVYDYGKQLHYKDGETTPIDLPKSEVVKFVLDDKSTVTVRPSGTEPKCKFYIEAVSSEKEGLKEKTENFYRSLLQDLKIKG